LAEIRLAVWEDFVLQDVRKASQSLKPEWFAGPVFLGAGAFAGRPGALQMELGGPLSGCRFFALAAGLFVVAGGLSRLRLTVLARLHGPLEKKSYARKGGRQLAAAIGARAPVTRSLPHCHREYGLAR